MDVHLPPSGRNLSVGTRVCLLVAGLLVIAAGYLLVSPLERASSQGPPFDCGTAVAPAAGDFARSVCGDLNQRRQLQGGAVLLAAVGLAGGGRLAFGPVGRRRRPDVPPWSGPQPGPPRSGGAPEWSRPPGRPALAPAGQQDPEADETGRRPEPPDPDRG